MYELQRQTAKVVAATTAKWWWQQQCLHTIRKSTASFIALYHIQHTHMCVKALIRSERMRMRGRGRKIVVQFLLYIVNVHELIMLFLRYTFFCTFYLSSLFISYCTIRLYVFRFDCAFSSFGCDVVVYVLTFFPFDYFSFVFCFVSFSVYGMNRISFLAV